jgi:predicted O-methyltransferase YrrM
MNVMTNHKSRLGGCRWFRQYRNKVGRDRHITMELLYAMACERGLKSIVETGSIRNDNLSWGGDGCSTIILADLALLLCGHLHTVDIDEQAIRITRKVTHRWNKYITAHVGDSVEFLKAMKNSIDILYLDSGNDDILQLEEIKQALPLLHTSSIVLLDDVPTKGPRAIEYMIDRGWMAHTLIYQALLIHPDSIHMEYPYSRARRASICADIPSFGHVNWDAMRDMIEDEEPLYNNGR